MTIQEIAKACKEMSLGETLTFDVPESHAPIEVIRAINSQGGCSHDFSYNVLDSGRKLVMHRTHEGVPEPDPWP